VELDIHSQTTKRVLQFVGQLWGLLVRVFEDRIKGCVEKKLRQISRCFKIELKGDKWPYFTTIDRIA
jgi:hypothetical protein